MLQGNSISVEWGQQYPVIYEVGSDGVLRGKWDNGLPRQRGIAGQQHLCGLGQQYPVIYQDGCNGVLRGTWSNGSATEDLFPKRYLETVAFFVRLSATRSLAGLHRPPIRCAGACSGRGSRQMPMSVSALLNGNKASAMPRH
jgi:hypothetical protein